jgi:hypothetical protein
MSLPIDPSTVTAVLLADRWHVVGQGSFTLDTYEFEYAEEPEVLHGVGAGEYFSGTRGGGQGFRFIEGRDYVSGPLTAVLAVRHGKSREGRQPGGAPQDNESEEKGLITGRPIDKPRGYRSSGDI